MKRKSRLIRFIINIFLIVISVAGILFGEYQFTCALLLFMTALLACLGCYIDYRKAVEENNFKNAFLANMSHEIKTPINTILGMNEMILRESKDVEIRSHADHIYEAGQLLLSLVNNILDYAKMESGKIRMVPVHYEIDSLLSNLIYSASTKAKEKKLRFDVDVDESIPRVLYGDEIRIRQAVMNLLTNSLKYTVEGSITLTVRAKRIQQKEIGLAISVTDTGVGIRTKDQKRLFDSFVRLEEKRNRSIEGTGLGMSITRQIMDMMHGKVEIESEYGKGSVFTLSFNQKIVEDIPIGRFEDWYHIPASATSYQENCYKVNDVKILAIDDNEMNLEVIQGLLKKTGARIDMAVSGEEGLKKAESIRYDLILLDHMMPAMDGIETLKRMQQIGYVREGKVPVIALTANSVTGAREDYLKKGFTDYVAKPVDYSALVAILKKYLPGKIEKCSKVQKEQAVCEEYLEQRGVHVKAALKYAGDDLTQYIHLLEIFTGKKSQEKQNALRQVYEKQNWKDYTTYVHGLKNEARTIGADKLADMAYTHEQKSREGDIAFVQEAFSSLIEEWEKTKEIVHSYLEICSKEQTEMLCKDSSEKGMTQDEWKKGLEESIHYLSEYKKKEALSLLQKLSKDRIAQEPGKCLERAMQAVKEYDYENAIHILREIL